ncbi:hypothetical protein WJX73_004708 [Symbiochloris irregularis]|uniref:Alpha/beta hydrolase n=1 Tax=Symbiochloris irregularis TaxID=706552 RepID=A0AAW1NLC0_9CHLO
MLVLLLVSLLAIVTVGGELSGPLPFRSFDCNAGACTLIVVHGLNMSTEEAKSAGQLNTPNGYTMVAPPLSDQELQNRDLTPAVHRLDSFVGEYSDQQVVLAGFSAGGQLVQRFALGGSNKDVPVYYIIGAPGSYAYLSTYRPKAPAPNCTDFNVWKFGLDGVHGLNIDVQGYLTKEVLLIVGSEDNNPAAVQQQCEDVCQGDSHLTRTQNYYDYVQGLGASNHSLQVVPGAGHDIDAVFRAFQLS